MSPGKWWPFCLGLNVLKHFHQLDWLEIGNFCFLYFRSYLKAAVSDFFDNTKLYMIQFENMLFPLMHIKREAWCFWSASSFDAILSQFINGFYCNFCKSFAVMNRSYGWPTAFREMRLSITWVLCSLVDLNISTQEQLPLFCQRGGGGVIYWNIIALWQYGMDMLSVYWWLTHWGRDKMDATSQTTFSSAFSWMKMYKFRLKFHWNLFLRVQLTIFHHWFR